MSKKSKSLSLNQIIEIADDAYGDNLIKQYHDNPKGTYGDTLAEFIAIELRETFIETDPAKEQLVEAHRVMRVAGDSLDTIKAAFTSAFYSEDYKQNGK